MELDVLHLHRLSLLRPPPAALKQELVVEPELELGHPAEVRSHLEGPEDLGAEHAPRARHEDIDALHHVEKDLILAVLDPLGPPRHHAGDGRRRLGEAGHLVTLLHNVLAQNLLIRDLGVPPVHHLIEKLVRYNKVVPDRLLLELPEVVLEHPHDVIQEDEERRGVAVPLGARHQVQVSVLDVYVANPVVNDDGGVGALRLVDH
mmetsp:Transcript_42173/g.98247  ORF Transcript_42173/g.98247 Transcript_42173/m.98247 type:complete len:204 (-) Transcript_42173:189-800(-)